MTTIEVFADVRCPFAHVGLRRLVERRAACGADVTLLVRAWPLELVNGAPLDAAAIDEEIDALREQVAPDLFSGFSVGRFPPTSLPALGLTAAAYEQDSATGEAVALGLRSAMFEDGLDFGDPQVLDDLAQRWGVTPPGDRSDGRVLADWADGRRRGVIGSPHFFVDGEGWFCPGLDITRDGGRLRILAGSEFDAFAERALGQATHRR